MSSTEESPPPQFTILRPYLASLLFKKKRSLDWLLFTEGDDCEIVTLDSLNPGIGIGTALLDAVEDRARQAHCTRLSITTTNDNLNALRFYQKRGFLLVAVYRNAVDVARKLKPQIPLIGRDGIPVHDEIELQMNLETWAGWNTRSHALGFRKEEHMFMLSRSAGDRLHTN